MGDFMTEVFANSLAPVGINLQRRIVLDEECSSIWKSRMVLSHEILETFFIFEQKYVDGFVRGWQVQQLGDIATSVG